MKRCKKCMNGCELACGGFGCNLTERLYVITMVQSLLCKRFAIKHNSIPKEPEYFAVKCLECHTISIFPNNKVDGRKCINCGGHAVPIGNALIKRE